jgi:hypothetical protein
VARLDQCLGQRAGLHNPGVPQPLVDALPGQITSPPVWP